MVSIGTYFQPGVVSPLLTWFAKIADEAVAWYVVASHETLDAV